MTSEREKFTWEVKLQPATGETITEKVQAYWSPTYDGIKDAVAHAARMSAWLRNKKKIDFAVIGDPVLVTD
jgi:hypothetical protein